MLPTPELSHLKEADYDHVYEPAEDSFALLDSLEQDVEQLRALSTLPLVLEIGSGTGIVSTFLQQSIFDHSLHLCTDINMFACRVTQQTSQSNLVNGKSASLDTVRTTLSQGLRLRNVDLIVFNPPYVPTCQSEIDTHTGSITASWAGGMDGLSITTHFLTLVPSLLAPTGLCYLLTVARNKPDELLRDMSAIGLRGSVALQRRAGREKLVILRIQRLESVST